MTNPIRESRSEIVRKLREADAAITGTLLARIQNHEFARLVVSLKAASQEAAHALGSETKASPKEQRDAARYIVWATQDHQQEGPREWVYAAIALNGWQARASLSSAIQDRPDTLGMDTRKGGD